MAGSKNSNLTYLQQGDVLVGQCDIPKDAKPIKGNILQHGELTGHAHRLHDGEFQIYETPKKEMYLRVTEPSLLKHEEHNPIEITPGEYRIGIIKEYDPFEKLTRRVLD